MRDDTNSVRFTGSVETIYSGESARDFLRFQIRVQGLYGKKVKTFFVNLCVIDRDVRSVANHLEVGGRVMVEGHLETFPTDNDGDGHEVIVERIIIPDREA